MSTPTISEPADPVPRDGRSERAQRLIVARERAGLSQRQLAERLAIGPSQIALYETDKAKPRPARFRQIADLLGVDPWWLMGAAPRAEIDGPSDPVAELTELMEFAVDMRLGMASIHRKLDEVLVRLADLSAVAS